MEMIKSSNIKDNNDKTDKKDKKTEDFVYDSNLFLQELEHEIEKI